AELLRGLGLALAEIASENLFSTKRIEVSMLSLDEPVFSTVDDPLLDYGSQGREELLKAWDRIFWEAKSRNVETVLHLHDTRDPLFWDVENLQIVESHVGDPLYASSRAKRMAEEKDKFFKVSVALTDFDSLIAERLRRAGRPEEEAGRIWAEIRRGRLNPEDFLEPVETLKSRLASAINLLGERVLYAGPECGLGGFPTYPCALECLKRTAEASKTFTPSKA
ncbi:MAG: hypothetical protein DRO52_06000, partial [Candidatus Hecatellales archaeon]